METLWYETRLCRWLVILSFVYHVRNLCHQTQVVLNLGGFYFNILKTVDLIIASQISYRYDVQDVSDSLVFGLWLNWKLVTMCCGFQITQNDPLRRKCTLKSRLGGGDWRQIFSPSPAIAVYHPPYFLTNWAQIPTDAPQWARATPRPRSRREPAKMSRYVETYSGRADDSVCLRAWYIVAINQARQTSFNIINMDVFFPSNSIPLSHLRIVQSWRVDLYHMSNHAFHFIFGFSLCKSSTFLTCPNG